MITGLTERTWFLGSILIGDGAAEAGALHISATITISQRSASFQILRLVDCQL
jgi:hypothetical protein